MVTVFVSIYPKNTFESISCTIHDRPLNHETFEITDFTRRFSIEVWQFVETAQISVPKNTEITFDVTPENGYTGNAWLFGGKNSQDGTSFQYRFRNDASLYIQMVPAEVSTDLKNAKITIDPDSQLTYTGKPVIPDYEITLNGSVVPSDCYDVTYDHPDGNIHAGQVTMTFTAKQGSGYTGSISTSYTIQKADPLITLEIPEETDENPQGVNAVITPYDPTAQVLILYSSIIPAIPEQPCTVVHDPDCPSLIEGNTLSQCTCSATHSTHDETCGYREAMYEWSQEIPQEAGTYLVQATLPEGTDDLNPVLQPVTGQYVLMEHAVIEPEPEPDPVPEPEPEPDPEPEPEPVPEPEPEPVPEPEQVPEPVPEPEPEIPEQMIPEAPVAPAYPTVILPVEEQILIEEPQSEDITDTPEIPDPAPIKEEQSQNSPQMETQGQASVVQQVMEVFIQQPVLAVSTAGSVVLLTGGTAAFAMNGSSAATGMTKPFRRRHRFKGKKHR